MAAAKVRCIEDTSLPAVPKLYHTVEPDDEDLETDPVQLLTRAKLGRAFLKAYALKTRGHSEPMDTIICDLVTDLLHAQYQSNPGDTEKDVLNILKLAAMHFSAEIRAEI